ncbi:MAG: FMN-binding protein [Chloroflexi bacterium]|nr:FMN-binding protein [Chloroflexota bacterium]
MKRRNRALMATALAAVPAAGVLTAPGPAAHASAPAAAAKAKKYKGPSVDMRWGPVQATVTIKGMKITAVSIATSPENFRSQFIDQQAVPILRQEVLQAQSASIDEVSGATMTSDAFIESLQSALQKAHFKAPTS